MGPRYTRPPDRRAVLRVVHLINSLEVGGAEQMLLRLVRASQHPDVVPTIVTLSEGGGLEMDARSLGIGVHHVGLRRGEFNPAALRRLVAVLHRARPDVIQSWMYHSNVAASLARPWLPRATAIVWNIRQSLGTLSQERFLTQAVIHSGRVLAPHADAIVNNSGKSVAEHQALGYHNARSVVIPNGFELDRHVADPSARAQFRAEIGARDIDVVVGVIARVHEVKDHATFLRAAHGAAERNPHIRFVCIGRGTTALHAPEDLRERLHLLGERNDVHRCLAGLDLVVSSSIAEGFPNALGEAMASAVPVIATDVGETATLVGDTGILIPPRDPIALRDAILQFASLSPTERAAFGRRAVERMHAQFCIRVVAERYRTLYHEVIAARRHRIARRAVRASNVRTGRAAAYPVQ